MKKQYSFESLFGGNKIVLLCIIFTVHIIIETIFSTIGGRTTYLSMGFLVWSILLLSAPVLPLAVFQYLWKSNVISDKDYLLWGGIPLHYIISSGLIMLFTFIRSLFEPLPQGSYLNALINYTVVYAIILIGAVVIDLAQTATANDNLKKIQARLNNSNKN